MLARHPQSGCIFGNKMYLKLFGFFRKTILPAFSRLAEDGDTGQAFRKPFFPLETESASFEKHATALLAL